MNNTAKVGWLALFATGLSVAAFAASKPDFKGPTPEQRKEFLEKRIAKLSPDEQRLARELAPLRDSLMHAMREYHHKVKDGAEPRSLTAERNTIASMESQIQRVQTENQEVWLDLLAHIPGPGDHEFGKHHGRPGMNGSEHPPRGDANDAPDELPPPPAP
jgi:hypothetical protein